MNARELRIGNWVNLYGDDCQVQTVGMWLHTDTAVKPIPLSEEWLERFGFKYHGGFRDSFYNDVLELYGSPVAKGYQVESMFDHHWPVEIHRKVVVEYVHQLQNLYFALTGEELTLKEK